MMTRHFKNGPSLGYLKSREGKILLTIIVFFVIEVNTFAYIERLAIADAIYFTIVTLGTVGYGRYITKRRQTHNCSLDKFKLEI